MQPINYNNLKSLGINTTLGQYDVDNLNYDTPELYNQPLSSHFHIITGQLNSINQLNQLNPTIKMAPARPSIKLIKK